MNFFFHLKTNKLNWLNCFGVYDEVIEEEIALKNSAEFQSHVYLNKAFRYGAFLNQQTKDSVYGEIPANWTIKKLIELGDFKMESIRTRINSVLATHLLI